MADSGGTDGRAAVRAAHFAEFCAYVGLHLEPFQHTILREAFSARRELLVLLPRGNGKTTLFAALALFELLTTREPAVYCAAASRDQASLLFDAARTLALSRQEIRRRVTVTRRELRTETGFVKVLAADAPKVHGLSPTLALVDELHAHRDAELYLALRTAMLKRPAAKLVTISTAGIGEDSPLGRLRARARALEHLTRHGALTTATGPNLAMLEWALADDESLDDVQAVKAANPASWITEDGLREQREAVPDFAFARYHANRWTQALAHWLPPGAWHACAADYTIEPAERVWIGVDIGGERAATAIVWITEDLRVGCWVAHGNEAVLHAAEKVRELAGHFDVAEVAFDPWRFQAPARELEQDGLPVVEFPQSNARMVAASERLYAAVIEQRLRHPHDPHLDRHVATAVAKPTPRGWRLDKTSSRDQIDLVVALAMALERCEHRPAPVEILGWL